MIILISILIIAILALLDNTLFKNKEITVNNKDIEMTLLTFIEKRGSVLLCIIIILYGIVSIYNLGNISQPTNGISVKNGTAEALVEFPEGTDVSECKYLVGNNNGQDLKVRFEYSNDLKKWYGANKGDSEGMWRNFFWKSSNISGKSKYIKFVFAATNADILEACFYDNKKKQIKINLLEGDAKLFDEQDKIPSDFGLTSDSYFDEFFYVQNAYDIINGEQELSAPDHPFLASEIIGLGMLIFGQTPFGYRIMGWIFGLLMIPLMYRFGVKVFGKKSAGLFMAFLMATDLMHFVQSRVATIETFVVFFLILVFYYLYDIYKKATEGSEQLPVKSFIFSGFFLGLAISCKWTGLYSTLVIIPISIICFVGIFRSGRPKLPPYLCKCVMLFITSFAVIPVLIYFLSYVPLMMQDGKGITYFFEHQQHMSSFHAEYTQELKYVSEWYEWLPVYQPFLYSGHSYINPSDTARSISVSSFGNPLLYWLFIYAYLYLFILAFKEKFYTYRKTAIFLTVSATLFFVPWLFVGRIKFIYYIYMHIPLLMLTLGLVCKKYVDSGTIKIRTVIVYCLFLLLTFIFFYPVLAGMNVTVDYIQTWLMVMENWQHSIM